MIASSVLLVAIASARAVGAFVWESLDDWRAAVRVGPAVMFIFTGLARFTRARADLIRMVPGTWQRPGMVLPLGEERKDLATWLGIAAQSPVQFCTIRPKPISSSAYA